MADYTQPDVVAKRVRFFDGQFLQDQDFIDEQKFHLDRERRQSRLLRLTGICAGLTVTTDGPYRVTVAGGTAVDSLGRHLVLAADTSLPLGESFANRQDVEVHLVYRESATDVAQTGGASARRWDESPKVVAVAPDGTSAIVPGDAPPGWDGPTVLLARLAVADNGDITVDATAGHRSSLSVSGALGVGTTDPGSDLQIGDFDPQDRHLTVKVAGGNRYRGGIRLWTGAENQGYSLEYDERLTAGTGLHIRSHEQDPDGTTRLFVGTNGDIGIGTTAPANADGWGRVVDVVGSGSSRLSVRTETVDAGVLAHDQGVFGAEAGMVVGTASASPLSFVTNATNRLSISASGHVGIGTSAAPAHLVVNAADRHLTLRRDSATDAGDKYLFLELMQIDQRPPTRAGASFNIRFHHNNRFWHRLEVRPDGFHFRDGYLSSDGYRNIHAGRVTASELRIGSASLGERELTLLLRRLIVRSEGT